MLKISTFIDNWPTNLFGFNSLWTASHSSPLSRRPRPKGGESEEGLELIEFLMSPLPPSLLFDQEDELEEEQSLESERESFQPQSAISWEGRERRLLWIFMSTFYIYASTSM